jgi:hypothetical protein
MSTYEDEIQRNLEEGKKPVSDDLDAIAYQHVFRALKKEPEFSLNTNFADQVIGAATRKRKKNTVREYFWFGTGTLLLLVAFVTATIMTDFKLSAGIFSGLGSLKGLLIFGASFIGLLNWVDKRLLKNKQKVI